MKLQKTFFRAEPFNPYIPPMELVFSKTTAGSFEYTIPSDARHVMIEIAGGNGNSAYLLQYPYGSGGRGGKVTVFGDIIGNLAGKKITGTIGATATGSTGVGGSGAPAGGNGAHSTPGGSSTYGGGGGGATSILIDGTEYQASGGGGATWNDYFGGYYHSVGGKGGGKKGGNPGDSVNQSNTTTNGYNAGDLLLNETSNGYIRVWKNARSNTLYEKTTPGAFSYTVPNTVSAITIEIAAGNGADGAIGGYSGGMDSIMTAGKGAVKVVALSAVNGKTITGIIGQSGGVTGLTQSGGSPDGRNGTVAVNDNPPAQSYGGGGGGHSECTIDGKQYIVSGGAGGAAKNDNTRDWGQGGKGGGPNGGIPVTNGNGGNGTDGDKLNSEKFGYIRIFKMG